MNILHLSLCCGAIVCTLSVAATSLATLGETATSVETDRKALKATPGKVLSGTQFTVREITSAASKVREYVSPEGTVFAIAWNGISPPDLTPLLGKYNEEYRAALQQAPAKRGNRRQQVKSGQVVVEKWGHMRNLQGRAYVPSLMPQGVTIEEIK